MKNIALISISICFLMNCHSKEQSSIKESKIKTDSIVSNIEEMAVVKEKVFIDFPIPELDSIFPYFETSGAVGNAPSDRFYNPVDSGIFVFYTLFEKQEKLKRSSKLRSIGTLITHTYFKSGYGWSEMDKDQTFILLNLNAGPISIGNSIRIGSSFEAISKELGQPIYQVDSSFVFLGKNKVVGQFGFKNGMVESITYGQFNLIDEVFDLDSLNRKVIIDEKLNSKK